ncbi:MAG TPA: VOC family protein [Sphingomonas sp.]|jgi:catechol 2,3-dioxygenase-like lactoylglutathione lyase family enzyme|uniref:VOC family protein n=1 Tax=Sphingomonas sp. TaxID=28214 RepID=UPI002EDA287D
MNDRIATLGPVMQLAFVPHDFEAAIRFWTETMGAGPFFRLPHIAYRAARYRGETSHVDFSVVLGYWGDMQIELVEQHCDSPSIYRQWLDDGREGLHHVCVLVDSIAHARTVCAAAGAQVVQEVFMDGAEAIYVDTGGGPGTMVELLEPSPDFAGLFAMMRAAARDWDGSDPVRPLG